MQKKLLVVLLVIFFTKANSFQDNFESTEIIVAFSDDVERFIANRPYGYCQRDGVPLEFCKTVTINLFGETYKRYALEPDLPFPVDSDLKIEYIKRNYHLGVDDAVFDVPTAGQLVTLINNEILPQDGECYWVKIGENNYRPGGHKRTDCESNNSNLNFLVTANSPAVCKEIDDYCGIYLGKQVTLRLKSAANLIESYNPSIRIIYFDGMRNELVTLNIPTVRNMDKEIILPLDSNTVIVFYVVNGANDGFKQNESNIDRLEPSCFEIMTSNYIDANLVEKKYQYTFTPCPDQEIASNQ